MRYQEFRPLRAFKAQVRLKQDNSLVLTLIWAEGSVAARRNLAHLYGTGNVLSVSEISLTEAKQLSAQDQQVKSLQSRAKQLTQQSKQVKARQSLAKAQDQLRRATAPAPAQAGGQS